MGVLIQPIRVKANKTLYSSIPEGRFKLVILRQILGLMNFTFFIGSLNYIPLFLVVIIHSLAPFWTTILAQVINKEKVMKIEYLCMSLCFICVLGITLPQDDTDTQAFKNMPLGVACCICRGWT